MSDITLDRIADIVPPVAPEFLSTDDAALIVLAAVVVVSGLVVWLIRSHRWKLQTLRWSYQWQKISNRQLAFELNQLLRRQLKLSRITPTISPRKCPLFDQEAWPVFCAQLDAACFSRNGLDDQAMKNLLHQTNHWLRVKC